MVKLLQFLSLGIFIVCFNTGCKKEKKIEGVSACYTEETVNSLRNVKASDIMQAYEEVTISDPSLLQDSSRLGCAIYNWLESYSKGQLKTTFDLLDPPMTTEEIIYLIRYAWYLREWNSARNMAWNTGETYFP